VIALLPFLLVAAPVSPEAMPSRVSRVATATVQIIKLESVSSKIEPSETRSVDRQYRQRDAMPLVEFF
jgi:hypothetical protein